MTDPNEKYLDPLPLRKRVLHRIKTKRGYKFVAETLGFIAFMTVAYWGLIVIAASMDAL